MKWQGLSVQASSDVTRVDRKTTRKCLMRPDGVPVYAPRAPQPSKWDPFKPYPEGLLLA